MTSKEIDSQLDYNEMHIFFPEYFKDKKIYEKFERNPKGTLNGRRIVFTKDDYGIYVDLPFFIPEVLLESQEVRTKINDEFKWPIMKRVKQQIIDAEELLDELRKEEIKELIDIPRLYLFHSYDKSSEIFQTAYPFKDKSAIEKLIEIRSLPIMMMGSNQNNDYFFERSIGPFSRYRDIAEIVSQEGANHTKVVKGNSLKESIEKAIL